MLTKSPLITRYYKILKIADRFKSSFVDSVPGGLADRKSPTDFDKKQLEVGTKVELEHTSNKMLAREIAMDHLTEDPNYYIKLKTVEK